MSVLLLYGHPKGAMALCHPCYSNPCLLQIYQSSMAYSPTAIHTSGGYYHMGTVFLKEGNSDCAASLHDQV